MIDGALEVITFIAAIGSGVNAGIFFPFSTFAMGGLKRLPPNQGAAAMQEMNITAVRPPLMIAMFGTAVVCVVAAVWAVVDWATPGSVYVLLGAIVFVLAIVILTVAYHVPRNDALAALDPESPEGIEYWKRYQREWTNANHIRTVAPMISAVAFTLALITG